MILMLFKTERAESRRGETQLLCTRQRERSVCAYRSGGRGIFEISMLDKSMPAEGGAEEGRSWWFGGGLEVGDGEGRGGEDEEVKEKIRAFQLTRRRHAVSCAGHAERLE